MGLSHRAYARHRGVSHTAVQKALRSGRIAALPDGTIDPVAADAAWNLAAEDGTDNGATQGDATRVILPPGSLGAAETAVRAVLAEHGAPAGAVLTMRDARLANELLRARQRAEAIRAERARVRYTTGVDLEAEDDAAREEAIGWWRWSDATAATLARALGVREARVVAVLALALRARLEILGLVAGDDEEDDEDEETDRDDEEEDDEDDDDKPEPLHVEPDEDTRPSLMTMLPPMTSAPPPRRSTSGVRTTPHPTARWPRSRSRQWTPWARAPTTSTRWRSSSRRTAPPATSTATRRSPFPSRRPCRVPARRPLPTRPRCRRHRPPSYRYPARSRRSCGDARRTGRDTHAGTAMTASAGRARARGRTAIWLRSARSSCRGFA
jgi:hypothetical protein